jgi:hypothetical protein
LGRVFCLGCIAQHAIAQVEDRSLVSFYQLGKRAFIAVAGAHDPESFVGVHCHQVPIGPIHGLARLPPQALAFSQAAPGGGSQPGYFIGWSDWQQAGEA